MPNGKDHEGRTKYKMKVIHEYFEHDKTYFENVTDILPSGEHVLEDGENEFNFEVFIPLDCLGSFHHSNGVRIGKGRLRPCGKDQNSSIFYCTHGVATPINTASLWGEKRATQPLSGGFVSYIPSGLVYKIQNHH